MIQQKKDGNLEGSVVEDDPLNQFVQDEIEDENF